MIESRLQEIKAKVLESEDVQELYALDIELTEGMSHYHKSLSFADTRLEQSEIKGNLNLCNSLLSILRDKVSEAKNTNNRLNHNFRMHAKKILDKTMYKQIMNEAIAGHSRKEKR